MKRRLLAVLLMGLACAHSPSFAPQPGNPYVRIVLHVPPEREAEAMAHVRLSKQALEEHGMKLVVHDVVPLAEIDQLDKATRKALTTNDDPRFIHVYYVNTIPKLDDGDPDGGDLRGIQWKRGRHVSFAVSDTAQTSTFTHELGHALGLDHIEGKDPLNAMCVCGREDVAGFTEDQALIMQGYKD